MANDLTVISGSNQPPAYLQQLQYEDAGVGSGIAPRAPRLGITTSKQFTLTKDGQTLILPEPKVRCVVVAGAENITKAWYAKSYVPGTTEAPDCFSNDGKVPASGVKAPQCSNCAACPKNAFGSHPVTGRGKACSDRKMVIAVWEGLPDELVTFNVPTMSLTALRKIDTELQNANIPMQAVLMELSFDPGVMYPVLKINAVGYVAQETAVALIARSRTSEISDLLRETDFETVDAQNTHTATPLVASAASTEAAVDPAPQQAANVVPDGVVRRVRRTKAEMEAARAAGQPQQVNVHVAELLGVSETPAQLVPEMTELEKLQAQLAALQAEQAKPQKTPEELKVEALQAQLAALQSGAPVPTTGQLGQLGQQAASLLAQSQHEANVQGGAQQPPAVGMDVTALLNKWKTN